MDIQQIHYRLIYPDGSKKHFELHVRADSLATIGWAPANPPKWAALEFNQCSNCPLNPNNSPHCPAALNLARLADECRGMDLLESVKLEVRTLGRLVSVSTTVQKALGSFIGVLMATSDCPHAAFFRPIARFHLPLATEAETMYRAVTAYLMAQLYRHQNNQEADFSLQGLFDIYQNLEIVNTTLLQRFKQASGETEDMDAVIQTMREWDVFSGMFPMRAEALLKELRPLFSAYLSE